MLSTPWLAAAETHFPLKNILKVAVNALTLCLTLGIANLINKAMTGEFLFFNQSAETKKMSNISASLTCLPSREAS
ncbi:hypothetical protein [Piscirickettsia salmonis]|uniref:hypothetical protein n=1 Tax=Piscirickettsia salmonis TaxID=1238 RepID=UPI00030EA0A6|nr:hypothetical protein [Piscirickettsia salmonis]AKP72931.1 hypothetical protein PSLF89_859 [Piscirickettsia salmonis LF-89 = ATCC VR-1361]ALY01765.1 hypothetical protein AWE47_01860 [Piscirickettsia salmonis]AMA41276.1 hypothetical protein AWJ11_01845 [Piscirickettsia salmonis]AOS36472.1 hypothetical protein AVM72_14835 [Piscirickettsia salmonis]APS61155.1 hypothetical protein AVI53_11790 [Piscirickettsia salmonis]